MFEDGHSVSNRQTARSADYLPTGGRVTELLREHFLAERELAQLEVELMLHRQCLANEVDKVTIVSLLNSEEKKGSTPNSRYQTLAESRLRGIAARSAFLTSSPGPAVAASQSDYSADIDAFRFSLSEIERKRSKLVELEQQICSKDPRTLRDIHGLLYYLADMLSTSPEVDVDFVAWKTRECALAMGDLLANYAENPLSSPCPG